MCIDILWPIKYKIISLIISTYYGWWLETCAAYHIILLLYLGDIDPATAHQGTKRKLEEGDGDDEDD